MPDLQHSTSHTVDLIRDWGLGGSLGYFKELVGVPPAGRGTREELAARLAAFLERRAVARDWRIIFTGEEVECRWRSCPFAMTARTIAETGATCEPCPIADIALDFWRRSGWSARLIRHGWNGEHGCGMTLEVKRSAADQTVVRKGTHS
jgi:hypothetical protein